MFSQYLYRNLIARWYGIVCWVLFFAAVEPAAATEESYTPLEKSDYRQLTEAAERTEYLQRLSAYPSTQLTVQYRVIGQTVEQRPIEVLYIGQSGHKNQNNAEKLRVMLLGAQHGSEISGCEALLVMAGNWVFGRYRPEWLHSMEILIIPAVNPDGIENNKRVNAQGVNLSTDFGLLSAPESSAVNAALLDFKPHVVLDIHESALLKKKSLGAEGWLTDFEAQFEYANNPNIDESLQQFSADVMLPHILETVCAQGLRSNRYIGEITRTGQVVTHGGLSAHNFRNKAALLGATSFLLENRLDVSSGTYLTPRNIKERVQKQILCISAFLDVCHEHAKQLMIHSDNARSACGTSATVWLQPAYVQDPASPFIEIPLCRIDTGNLIVHRFHYRKDVVKGPANDVHAGYRISSQTDFFAGWLEKQGIPSVVCSSGTNGDCIEVKTNGPNGCLLPLYLEETSSSSILGRLMFDADIDLIQTDQGAPRKQKINPAPFFE